MPIAQVRLQGAEALALLRRARELVATPRRWTTGTYARNKQGAPVAPRKETKPTRFCASGAVLYAEHEAHGTWIENRPGLYFETESTRIIGPPRMLLALDMLAAALLGEFALALTRSGRPNERRSDYQRLMLTESATPADVVDRINDNPTITHAAVLASCAQAKPSCCNKTENYAYDDTIPAGRCSRIASSAPPPISRVHNVSRQDC